MIDAPVIIHMHDDAQDAAVKAPAPLLVAGDDDQVTKPPVQLPADFPENAKPVNDGSGAFILHLEYPVTLRTKHADETITSEVVRTLHLKRLNGKAQMAIARYVGTDEYRPQMIASSTGMTLGRAIILHGEMDAADIQAAIRVILFFTAPGRATRP